MVAFVTALLIGLAGCAAVLIYGRRRPVGAPLSWGEAMAAAMFAFLMFFWWYGVIPHQWIDWADRELVWSKSKFLVQHGQAGGVAPAPGQVDPDKAHVRSYPGSVGWRAWLTSRS